ncbi:hypothetical protein LZ518_11725 [Sphingomonas sp. RB56-2]|uniref:Helix-turn-helix domain-containing protein n=1 Tax=Sphingomonas brevis TaxID=2908206 RepID=A0ABT0SBK8_9SPHN|nr:hypothetical protein [Sphingomonas brevis]MCL6741796.1 hypothetical protein [Sphingomonas brevis]
MPFPVHSGALDVRSFCKLYDVGRSKVFELLASRELQAKRFGGKVLISAAEAERWFNSLPERN